MADFSHLHDKLAAAWQAFLSHKGVDGLLLLLCLHDLDEAADGVDTNTVAGVCLLHLYNKEGAEADNAD